MFRVEYVKKMKALDRSKRREPLSQQYSCTAVTVSYLALLGTVMSSSAHSRCILTVCPSVAAVNVVRIVAEACRIEHQTARTVTFCSYLVPAVDEFAARLVDRELAAWRQTEPP